VGLWHTALNLLGPIVTSKLASHGTFISKCGYRSIDGSWLHSTELPESELLFLPKHKLLQTLREAVDSVDGIESKQTDEYDASDYDLIVGCEGMHSPTRDLLLNPLLQKPLPALKSCGYTVFRGNATTESEITSFQTWGSGDNKRFAVVPLSSTRAVWFATVNSNLLAPSSPSPAGAREAVLGHFSNWHDPVSSLVRSTDEIVVDEAVQLEPLLGVGEATRPLNVALVGDARAAFDPVLAQGFTIAIEDAFALERNLLDLKAYYRERGERMRDLDAVTKAVSFMSQPEMGWIGPARNLCMMGVPGAAKEMVFDYFKRKSLSI
jgi:2-polyprenyl-6-methoxyphenol hydroxylase-like FAD-dependent oxidoreductase